ncbi:MAG: double-strand break repair helicase AddA [Pseudolabrys sp.]|nr:double-strand break repair helicase AddA [Pseudolabrys sp.]
MVDWQRQRERRMTEERVITRAVLDKQRQASDPETSAWVSANAGSGKTHVLAQRVIRLLLSGVDPARILCITFTKAAAANMANRVFEELRKWTALGDDALAEVMRKVGARDTGAPMRARARRLFALALETPGGLKVQTIHAFCTHVLHLFPFEANCPARFTVLDEVEEAQLLEHMTNEVLLDAAANPESAIGRALRYAIGAVADLRFRELIAMAIAERDAVTAWLKSAGGVDGAAAQLSSGLGVAVDDSEDRIAAEFLGKSVIPRSDWAEIAKIARTGKDSDVEQATRFDALPSLVGARQIERYIEIFCTKTSGARKNVLTVAFKKSYGNLCERLETEKNRIWALIERRRAVAARDRTIALVTIAEAVLKRFGEEKNRRGLLDFEDQIDRTHDLLARTSSAWVHYKLDRGIDHVLIDEAQDTSRKQWGIVRHLVAEFFAGQGASDKKRTIFAVGDEKQSIFSFQGAAPAEFESMRIEFESLSLRSGQPFRRVVFDTSLRSGPNVLSAVDQTFSRAELAKSLTHDVAGIPAHIPLESALPGQVEIWDTEKPLEENSEKDPWNAPFDTLSGTKPVVRLADRIAKHARSFIAAGGRAGQMLILVNRRGALFDAVIRALKNADVPVAGADRLVLTEHIAVMDLLVLADALLLPQDDLALATVLKSPLFDLNEDDIFDLAYSRGTAALRTALAAKAAAKPRYAAALKRLEALAVRARDTSPFEFYARLLGADGGRERFVARLGHEASDALDEFLNFALDYERAQTPTLQGFVHWLREARSEVKRDMEILRDEVRVMTVHGAKGLEAPVVILADTTTKPEGYHPPVLLTLPAQSAAPPLIWARGKENDIGPMQEARGAAIAETCNEHRRLLYVAMTRAIERLIVCGVESAKRPADCWYELVFNGLNGQPGFGEYEEAGQKIWRYQKVATGGSAPAPQGSPEEKIALPVWLKQPVVSEGVQRTIRPSVTEPDQTWAFAETGQSGRERGRLAHRLLQSLPDLPSDARRAAAEKYVGRSNLDAHEKNDVATKVLAVIAAPKFAALFTPGSRAEIPIIGRVQLGDDVVTVNGQVDRLAVTENEILIADYKTNRPAPRRIADVPAAYIRQLALYRGVLEKLYPGKGVRAALIWTEAPDLMEISKEVLDAALASHLHASAP